MSRLRAILVAILSVAVTSFPLAAACAQGGISAAVTEISDHTSCEKQARDGNTGGDPLMSRKATADPRQAPQGPCGMLGDCGGTCLCFGLTAALLATPDVRMAPLPAAKTARVAVSVSSLAYLPPSPPPRL